MQFYAPIVIDESPWGLGKGKNLIVMKELRLKDIFSNVKLKL